MISCTKFKVNKILQLHKRKKTAESACYINTCLCFEDSMEFFRKTYVALSMLVLVQNLKREFASVVKVHKMLVNQM